MYLSTLKKANIKLVCCSNSISQTVKTVLKNLGIIDFFDSVYSNEDVKNAKPHPEMYWAAMIKFSIKPNETVIVEDSPVGRLGAKMSGCNTIFINEPNDIDEKLIDKILNMDSKK